MTSLLMTRARNVVWFSPSYADVFLLSATLGDTILHSIGESCIFGLISHALIILISLLAISESFSMLFTSLRMANSFSMLPKPSTSPMCRVFVPTSEFSGLGEYGGMLTTFVFFQPFFCRFERSLHACVCPTRL